MDVRRQLLRYFWRVNAPLIALSAVVMWLVWHALVGYAWQCWAAAAVPVLGGIGEFYPWRSRK